jgi:hypothetical protein
VILADVMDEIGAELETIAGLRVTPFAADHVQVPAAVVAYPETIDYDQTWNRGVDKLTFPIFVLVGKMWDRTARDELSGYVNGAGAASVKAVLEAGAYTAMSSLKVQTADVEAVSVAGVEYLAAVFSVDVYGSGA